MNTLEILFFVLLFIVFYTYVGYGILLWILVKIKQSFISFYDTDEPKQETCRNGNNTDLPEITLFITAYNEEQVVDGKMKNCQELDYPKEKLHTVWVTDGSNDRTNEKLKAYPDVTLLFVPERKGKTAAMNRGMGFVTTPLVIFTDANTFINPQAVREIVKCFNHPQVGCVAGEKRVDMYSTEGAVSGGEGLYWKYESFLKKLDSQLHSAVGAAGELFAIRTSLYEQMPNDTLLDDFILSLKIAMKKYIIAYCNKAYAMENGSANMKEEEKRKVRIAAGGIQAIYRLRKLLNPFRYGILSFQYVSHRVLRWSITPIALFLLVPLNVLLIIYNEHSRFYIILLVLQLLFYAGGSYGYYLSTKSVKNKLLYIPYYFLFMNINVIKGFFYFIRKNKNDGTWEKVRRAV
jgi:cellulose synthase/poly-beta-1,6-N-acetylglucosamine synthase-like glycosyltransferase